MANIEGEGPMLEEMKLPGEESVSSEPAPEVAPNVETASETASEAAPGETVSETAEVESVEAAEEGEHLEEEPEEEKPPSKLPVYLEYAGLACIPLILLTLGYFEIMFFSTALYLIALGLIPYGIWKGRKTNNVYSIILGCALAAMFTAIFCLWIEFDRRYQGDLKAQEVKQRVSAMEWDKSTMVS